MKNFLQSSSLILAVIFVANLLIMSCNNDNDDPIKPPTPLLSSTSSYELGGLLQATETYKYDANGRLTELNMGDDYKIVFEYSPSSVILKEYKDDVLDITSTYSLNSKSLCDSVIMEEEGTTTFTYDNNGYLTTSFEDNGNSTYSETYIVSNRNYVTITSEDRYISSAFSKAQLSNFIGKSALMRTLAKRMTPQNNLKSATDIVTTYTTNYQFYTDKTNTIDYENMGVYFFGKQNFNPIKLEIEVSSEWPADTTTYSYEYDTKGRISKMIFDSGDYYTYTYID